MAMDGPSLGRPDGDDAAVGVASGGVRKFCDVGYRNGYDSDGYLEHD
jgi:hypothetical protein